MKDEERKGEGCHTGGGGLFFDSEWECGSNDYELIDYMLQ